MTCTADKPIIFSAPMVRALREGRKTQTRRIYKVPAGSYVEQGRVWAMTDGCQHGEAALPYAPGDRLWAKEAWQTSPAYDDLKPSDMGGDESIRYAADGKWESWGWGSIGCTDGGRKRSPIHMPRWASRLTLIVTDVRVQRLQEISDADAAAEGCRGYNDDWDGLSPREEFRDLWNSLHGPDAWGANPWVSAISFEVMRANIDRISTAIAEGRT